MPSSSVDVELWIHFWVNWPVVEMEQIDHMFEGREMKRSAFIWCELTL